MAWDNMGAFIEAGKQGGQASQTPFGYGAQNIMDLFKQQQDNAMKLVQTAALFKGEQGWANQNDPAKVHSQMQIDAYKKGGGAPGGVATESAPNAISGAAAGSQPGGNFNKDDYYQEPVMKDIGGIPVQMSENKLKPPLDATSAGMVNQMRTSAQTLARNINLMTPGVQKFMNPLNPLAQRGGMGDTALQAMAASGDKDAQDFVSFKAETDKQFATIRKQLEGARAAYGEWQWIEPDWPKSSDSPAVYIKKSIQSLKDIKDGEATLLDTMSNTGYRVGPLRKGQIANTPEYQQLIQKHGGNQNVLQQSGNKEADRAEISKRIASGKYGSSQAQMKKDFEAEYGEPL